jgi:methyl-accepting chemotaxis protein
MGTVEATNIFLLIIALASVVQVALLVTAAVQSAKAVRSLREQVDELSGRVERMAGPVLASAEHAMDEVGRAAAAVQDIKHRAEDAVASARHVTGRAVGAVGAPALSVVAAVAGMALSVLRRRRYRRTGRYPIGVN